MSIRNRSKRLLYVGAGAVGITLGAAALAGAATNQSPQPTQPAVSQQDQGTETSTETPENDTTSEADEAAALESQASVTADEARQAALGANPGGTVTDVQLGDEDGTVVYEVTMTDASGAALEVKVDANDGTVVGQDVPDAEEKDGSEAVDANETDEADGANETDGIDHQHEGEETGENGNGVPDAGDAAETPTSAQAG